ncbi:ammonium transporter [Alicyclobacillus acidocaldarius]|uniref:Ammonium transporter n=1 Tax=Alicyclobacillus acidocaldarius subsp. acidocaldarius (strain ATCC 27009 / DSM 446 / BCRC 14685 / JCM 5260 / KCTC 1825 / NBRC 15652 / NCIMB 11725 / NRRL B-14509 / 104-IA) TaxID=521098 RepID=C8WV59_ALIAD|nr:ammonium transporter [Alicyclobacillus acidocaldarius]ACV59896.1 ammonium transporter [Alicyclobacillus acidocaldarius subsp. acidocaldarius DSM 446]
MSSQTALNAVWVVLAAALVLFMEGGFSLLEAGLVRTKNAVNVTMKVFVDLTFGVLAFYLLGVHLAFGPDVAHLWGFGPAVAPANVPQAAFVLFQIGFAIAAASIISGAVAERMKFSAYVIIVILVCALVYPLGAHWAWGPNGWLGNLGMEDFAGSAVIHAMGGFMALGFAKSVGPRAQRFNADGSVNVFAPSNIPLASAGAFILAFGWIGFNAGSTLNAYDPRLSSVALNTVIAAAAGGAAAVMVTMIRFKVADPSMMMNGVLSGLVAITAGCAFVSHWAAIVIGVVAGIVVVFATGWLDAWKVDDPVGAFAVHGAGGVWGTLAVGLFDTTHGLLTTGHVHLALVQLLACAVYPLWGLLTSLGIGWMLHRTLGMRVSAETEEEGIDVVAHGIPAYNELERFTDL